MPTVSASAVRSYHRRVRSMRLRAGIARTFGTLFLSLGTVMLFLGAVSLYDAFTNPLTADSAQILIGSVCLAFALLLILFLLQVRR